MATDTTTLNNLARCYLSYGTIGSAQLYKLGLLVQIANALAPSQATDPNTLLALTTCYGSSSNAGFGDLFELGLLQIIAQNI